MSHLADMHEPRAPNNTGLFARSRPRAPGLRHGCRPGLGLAGRRRGITGSSEAARQDHATPEDVVAKVRKAARYLAERGQEDLARFKGRGSGYVWKDLRLRRR